MAKWPNSGMTQSLNDSMNLGSLTTDSLKASLEAALTSIRLRFTVIGTWSRQ